MKAQIIMLLLVLAACGTPTEPTVEQMPENNVVQDLPPKPEIEPPTFGETNTGMEAEAKQRVFQVDITQAKMEPQEINVKRGDTVKLYIHAVDYNHDFQMPALGISKKIDRGEVETVEFIAGLQGSFEYKCMMNCAQVKGVLKVS